MINASQLAAAAPVTATLAMSGSACPAGLRYATGADLETVNRNVDEAVASWGLADRVRRLALPSLLYNKTHLDHMTMVLAERDGIGVAVAAWEEDPGLGLNLRALTLHGLYVTPSWQRRGLGASLVAFAGQLARAHNFNTLTTNAWRESIAFFLGQGFNPIAGPDRDGMYPLRMSRAVQ